MSGKLFLGGGGSAEQSKALDDELVTLLRDVPHPTCLYVPVAMDEAKHDSAREWFFGTYGQHYADIEMLRRLTDLDHREAFDVIYMGGGNTGRLLDQIYESGFDKYLLKHLDEGRAVYGGSAGAVVIGRTILTTPVAEHSARSNDGLNLLGDRAVVVHYDDGPDRERTEAMARTLDCTLLAIPEDAGVIADGQHLQAVGGSDVVVFEPGRHPHSLKS